MPVDYGYNNLTMYSDAVFDPRQRSTPERDPSNQIARRYLELSLAANVPSFPLSDPFLQAQNYKGGIYLGIQHFFRVFSTVRVGLERKLNNDDGTPAPGAQASDPEYVPYEGHDLNNILRQPNPADTAVAFLCHLIMNWNLHGRILIWGRPNKMGAPEYLYPLPVPLCTPAYNVGNTDYPLGAWRIQQYYPTTGLSGVIPTGLSGMAGAVIDRREVYEFKNPHPIWRWAPYSHLFGGEVQVDLCHMIDRSFHSVMRQGIRPSGVLDMPGASDPLIDATYSRMEQQMMGPDNAGKPFVIGGGDPTRPAAKWQPFFSFADGTPHEEGWARYMGFILALMGLNLTVVGLNPGGGFAEKWAAKQEARENTYLPFLAMVSDVMTNGPVRQWGLDQKGVRAAYHLPQSTGYEPSEMSRDMAGDGSGTLDEVRALRGMKPAKKYGDMPVSIALKLIEKDAGVDVVTEQEEITANQADQDRQTMTMEQKNNPENQRPENEGGEGSLGGEGAGAPKPGANVKANGQLSEAQAKAELSKIMKSESRNDPGVKGGKAAFKKRPPHIVKYVALLEALKARAPSSMHWEIDYHIRSINSLQIKAMDTYLKCGDGCDSMVKPPKQGKKRKKKRKVETKALGEGRNYSKTSSRFSTQAHNASKKAKGASTAAKKHQLGRSDREVGLHLGHHDAARAHRAASRAHYLARRHAGHKARRGDEQAIAQYKHHKRKGLYHSKKANYHDTHPDHDTVVKALDQFTQERLEGIVNRVLTTPVILNGKHQHQADTGTV